MLVEEISQKEELQQEGEQLNSGQDEDLGSCWLVSRS